jgi:biotin synthase
MIRVSIGAAIVLGLLEGKLDAAPTTAYLMTYWDGKCSANCGFCPQARASKSSADKLSRVTWPAYPTKQALSALAEASKNLKIRRVCIQALNYPDVFSHLEALVTQIKRHCPVAVSVSCQPQSRENIERLRASGADRLGIALDAASKALFCRVKGRDVGGPYSWENQFLRLKDALAVFGRGNVSTHIIVGLGETEKEALQLIQCCSDLGILPALFAFTPVRGTALETSSPPPLDSYRRIQLARYLIVAGKAQAENMCFDSGGRLVEFGVAADTLMQTIEDGLAFRTSGCPDCNRPYYNERPGGPIYNYPHELSRGEVEEAKKQLLRL